MIKDEPLAINRVIAARFFGADGNGLSLAHTFSVGDFKLVQPDGTVANATNLPTAISGAAAGSFKIQLEQSEVHQLGVLRLQVASAGMAYFEWAEQIVTASSVDANAVVAAMMAFTPDPSAPNPNFQTVQHIFNVLAAYIAAGANGFPFSVQQQLDYKSLDGTKSRLTGNISNGTRSIAGVDGT